VSPSGCWRSAISSRGRAGVLGSTALGSGRVVGGWRDPHREIAPPGAYTYPATRRFIALRARRMRYRGTFQPGQVRSVARSLSKVP
jgi:hypothetical protein